jgi:hypothetical protein
MPDRVADVVLWPSYVGIAFRRVSRRAIAAVTTGMTPTYPLKASAKMRRRFCVVVCAVVREPLRSFNLVYFDAIVACANDGTSPQTYTSTRPREIGLAKAPDNPTRRRMICCLTGARLIFFVRSAFAAEFAPCNRQEGVSSHSNCNLGSRLCEMAVSRR